MRIHSNVLDTNTIRTALDTERATERIAAHVRFKTLAVHGSHTHTNGFEVQLEALERAITVEHVPNESTGFRFDVYLTPQVTS